MANKKAELSAEEKMFKFYCEHCKTNYQHYKPTMKHFCVEYHRLRFDIDDVFPTELSKFDEDGMPVRPKYIELILETYET